MNQSELSAEHRDFYKRFKSFWADPSGERVAEIISPDATIHFSGQGTFSGAEYIHAMQGTLDSFEGLEVTPLDCAGNDDLLYIHWKTAAIISGERREYVGVDRFRIKNGMAVEEYVIFDTAVLAL
ncbi:nuclear transport factor 2 family protein [Erythrobacter ani]|uniref:Nuclear transport factor 2 family protein n=1 Tax=Erythrobacter ani TaxID=2827235 RepID=A0ABS6SLQ7_9SPHN|nr:nuclear transport factor 2 family protein [Erythrobacter ani]MBV7265961.1 nuclear transport factor 2 family protein [Erythrobacter ani]